MIVDVDIRTLYVTHALVMLSLSGLMVLFWRAHRGTPGLGLWTLGLALLDLTVAAATLRGTIPDLISVVLGNYAGVIGGGAIWNGIRQFAGKPVRWAAVQGLAIVVMLFVAWHTYRVDDVLVRIVGVSSLMSGGCLLCARELRGLTRELRGTALPTALLFVALAVTLAYRALSTALWPPGEPSLFAGTTAQSIHFLGSIVVNIMVVFGLLMMAAQRLGQRAETRNAELQTALATAETRARELAESRQQLAAAQRLEAMGQLTGGVAHDFNNLMTVVAGAAEMMARGTPDPARLQRHAAAIQRAVARGQRLTQSLLAFARRDIVKPEVVDPGRMIREFEPLLRRAVGETVELSITAGPDLHPVHVDPSRLETALLNLVLNARDAMPAGGAIAVTLENVLLDAATAARHPDAKPGPHLLIAVRDDGTGMPAEVVAKAFEPFFSTKPVGKGSGLGLSQVYGMVHGAGGTVAIDSAPGRGTTIRLLLPRTELPGSVAEARPPAPADAQRGDATVLIVEDDPMVLDASVECVAALGYRTLTASNADEALRHLRAATRIDLMFSDVILPGSLDGPRLAAAARALRPGLPVVLATGYAGEAARGLPAELGIDVISKPYRGDELATRLQAALAARGERPPAAASA